MEIDATKLRRLRQTRAWSQEQLAGAADISVKTVRRVESGTRSSLETVKALASALETDVSALMRVDPELYEQPPGVARTRTTLGEFGPLLAAIEDSLTAMHHWHRYFADLSQFHGIFCREPDPPLFTALKTAQPLAAKVSLHVHRDVLEGVASLERMQHLVASTGAFVRSTARIGYEISTDVQESVRAQGHEECDHVKFYLARARNELLARAYPQGAA